MIVFRLRKEKNMNTRNYKVYTLALAIITGISLSLAPVAKAEQTRTATQGPASTTTSTPVATKTSTSSGTTAGSSTSSSTAASTSSSTSQTAGNRGADWYSLTTVSNPLLGMSYTSGAYGPNFGYGQTGTFSSMTNPYTGTVSKVNQDMTYAGGAPVYAGAGSQFQYLNYGAMTGMVNSMSGLNSYDPAAAYTGLGYNPAAAYTGLGYNMAAGYNSFAMPNSYMYSPSSYYTQPSSYMYSPSSYYAQPSSYMYSPSSYYTQPNSYYTQPNSYYTQPNSYYTQPNSYLGTPGYANTSGGYYNAIYPQSYPQSYSQSYSYY